MGYSQWVPSFVHAACQLGIRYGHCYSERQMAGLSQRQGRPGGWLSTADPGGANGGHGPPQNRSCTPPPKKKKKKKKKRKEKKKKRGKKRDKTKPHNFTPPPCAAKSCLYVQLLLKYANYNTLIGYMNVFIILLTIQHCHKICNGSLCS